MTEYAKTAIASVVIVILIAILWWELARYKLEGLM